MDYCVFVAHPASELANVKQACIAITQEKYVYVAEGRAQVLVHLSMLTPTGRRGGVDHGVGILKLRHKRFKFPTPGNQKKMVKISTRGNWRWSNVRQNFITYHHPGDIADYQNLVVSPTPAPGLTVIEAFSNFSPKGRQGQQETKLVALTFHFLNNDAELSGSWRSLVLVQRTPLAHAHDPEAVTVEALQTSTFQLCYQVSQSRLHVLVSSLLSTSRPFAVFVFPCAVFPPLAFPYLPVLWSDFRILW